MNPHSTAIQQANSDPLGIFGRYLTLWVALCIIIGIFLGNVFPALFRLISYIELSHINLVVAVLIWIMIYPMMVNVDFNALKHIGERPKGLIITSITNWLIKPFTMALLGMFFFNILFKYWVSPENAKEYIAGMILLGAAPCTAMVFVWSQLTRGDATYTLVQVSLNDLIMVFAYAPIVAFLLGMSDIIVPWETLLLSILLYVVIPLIAGYFTRVRLMQQGDEQQINQLTEKLKPLTIIGLLLTVVLLFGFQGQTILSEPFIIFLIAIPLTIQSVGVAGIAYYWAWLWRVPLNITAPVTLIGSSNFFELAVAVAISLFGLQSGAALATVVGVLVEVPVMLFVVYLVNKNADWYTRSITS
ncbi:ACR3 family arsenite efflux transporter [Beggiatoa leptomitoformis]|uniref:ACR3 family arsenite efflux transporter n=1 Tax=Beggiatoa leptomitoformis TaxID=288004 RepID=A0A2N9YCE8_9GAMM|nr:ACR3 family arsenite efflux transporter [Beggiatoa leptomitoformis]ALG66566.1 ACR3 family arsenite efflux transporter [Beggiatoa leptomitoformis]AUI68135.1 ACR3 family arsenite efflux transporter [Beggiatoa leptomitoformis]